MVARLHVYLLGGFQLQSKGAALPPIASRTGRSLLAYLLTHRERAHTRDLLVGKLWPDTEETKARRRLSQSLWHIQSVLAPIAGAEPFILTEPATIRFNTRSDAWIDVAEYEEQIALAKSSPPSAELDALRRAVELYRGDFMAGYYDEWAYQYQGPLRDDFVAALSKLTRMCKARGGYEEALGYAHQMVVQDPFREASHREIMRLSFLLGRYNEALQQYDRLSTLMQDELGVGPDPQSEALRREILDAREKGDRPFTPTPTSPLFEPGLAVDLVGREDERAGMIHRIERVLDGEGGVVLVEGESGVGKTHFLRQAADDANWRGVGIIWGESDPDMRRPYEALRNGLERVLSPLRASQLEETVEEVWLAQVSRVVPRLAELLPDLRRPPPLKPEEEPDRMREAFIRVFRSLAGVTPQAYFVDDIQWADEETLAVLVRLADVAREAGILLCLGYRSQEARERAVSWDAIRRLDTSARAERTALRALDLDETAELVHRATGRVVTDDFAEGLHYETGGNPLFVLETLRAMHEQDALDDLSRARLGTLGPELPLSPGVAQVIGRRVESAGPGVRPVLDAAAVYGPSADPAALVAVTGRSRAEVLTALDEAVRRRLLAEEERGFRFSHEQIQRVVYSQIEGERRVELHGRAGGYVEERAPGRVEDLAHHYAEAGEPEKAAGYLRLAAAAVLDVYAYDAGARHLERALAFADAAGWSADERYATLADYEEVLDVLGRRDEQEAVLDSMAELAGEAAPRVAEVLRRRAWFLANTSRFDEAEKYALEALEASPADERADALIALGMTLNLAGRQQEAVPLLEEAVACAGTDRQSASVAYALGSALSELAEYERAGAELEKALLAYRDLGDRRMATEVLNVLGAIAHESAASDAGEYHAQGIEEAQAIGYVRGVAVNCANLANVRRFAGLIEDARRLMARAAAGFAGIGDRRAEALLLVNRASLSHTYFGDDDSARNDAEVALELFRASGHGWGEAHCYDVLGGIAVREGNARRARDYYERGREAARTSGHRWLEANLLQALALLELEAGDAPAAMEHAEEAEAICEALDLRDASIVVRAIRARCLLALGRKVEALGLLRQSVGQLHDGVDQRYRVSYWHFVVAAAAGHDDEARIALDDAHRRLQAMLDRLPDGERTPAAERVPLHAEITEAWARTQPTQAVVQLPASGVPTGRPLRPDDYRNIEWTIHHPDDQSMAGADRRRRRLLRLLSEADEQGGSPTVEHLADALGASVATIRRDLKRLRSDGHDVRTRGARGPTGS